ncbi:MAG: transposase [Xanthomonadaceae bacterium]|nr:transposase [Xanthomonadaceae bacterium]MDP2186780.1 transposase [Xanthomonadales bacterium]MDZ4114387.1 transposase [Xanthomonadaceae bacterium]MDZ4378753.1 transposase [Xanthomonadaceae bacterium]
MSRPLRIEFDGAVYHVMARGNAREPIFFDDQDRRAFLDGLWQSAERFDWWVWAYCLMDNHYHLLIETRSGKLSRGMRELNGVYTQRFNRRHHRVGHLLQGRFQAVLVDKDSYLLELLRYIVLNPMRAGMVSNAGAWPWSSYQSVMGKGAAPPAQPINAVLALFSADRGAARRAFARFVAQGVDADDPTAQVTNQVFLGSDAFIEKAVASAGKTAAEVPKRQRRQQSLAKIAAEAPDRDTAMRVAYQSGNFTLKEIGGHFGLHYATVSRLVKK